MIEVECRWHGRGSRHAIPKTRRIIAKKYKKVDEREGIVTKT